MCAFPYTLNCTNTYTEDSYTDNSLLYAPYRRYYILNRVGRFDDQIHNQVGVDNQGDVAYVP